jgi:hypothetical protein
MGLGGSRKAQERRSDKTALPSIAKMSNAHQTSGYGLHVLGGPALLGFWLSKRAGPGETRNPPLPRHPLRGVVT